VAVRPKPRSNRLLLVVFISISLLAITVDYRGGQSGPLAALGRAGLELMAPLQKAVTNLTRPIGNFFVGVAHLPSLEQENQRLRVDNAALRAKTNLEATKDAEIARLQELLGISNTLEAADPIAAQVIGSGLSNFDYTMTIDQGSTARVQVDDPVVAGPAIEGQALLVGHVISVAPDASVVLLTIDRTSAVGSKLASSNATGLVQGQGQDDMTMSLVDPTTHATSEDYVLTSGYKTGDSCGLYPPGLVVGQVSRTIPPTNDLQAFVLVRPAVDFSQLQEVVVLRGRKRVCS
jgi:rod shape-determining protein MreC